MDALKHREITCQYYSKWLGQDGLLQEDFRGIRFLYSEERNRTPYGYGAPLDLYALCQGERIVISYGDRAADKVEALRDSVKNGMSAAEIRQTLERLLERRVGHSVKYVFERASAGGAEAKVLETEAYGEYEAFWKKCHPTAGNTEWLRDYFEEMARERMCVGVFADGVLASCTDAPGLPFMEDQAGEIGINTLPEYRGRGYAFEACARCAEEIVGRGKTPLWSAPAENAASRRLAEKVGFAEFAEVLSVTL